MEAKEKTQSEGKDKRHKKIYYRKRVELFMLIDKVKLWPSRNGILHGIKSIEKMGDQTLVTTHCNEKFMINNSRNSRAARWLRNKWFLTACEKCNIPDWKLKKYALTYFNRHQGSFGALPRSQSFVEGQKGS